MSKKNIIAIGAAIIVLVVIIAIVTPNKQKTKAEPKKTVKTAAPKVEQTSPIEKMIKSREKTRASYNLLMKEDFAKWLTEVQKANQAGDKESVAKLITNMRQSEAESIKQDQYDIWFDDLTKANQQGNTELVDQLVNKMQQNREKIQKSIETRKKRRDELREKFNKLQTESKQNP